MIKQLLLVVLGIVSIIVARAMFIPGSFSVQRSITVQAPPEKIFPLLNDFQHVNQWSPWQQLDTAMASQISTPSAGPGAVYEWRGNSRAGSGRMEILESKPSSSVRLKLDFLDPFERQHHRLHAHSYRDRHHRDLEDARSVHLPVEGDAGVHVDGRSRRRRLRARPRISEGDR